VSKRARRTKNFNRQETQVIDFSNFKKRDSKVVILPKNLTQEDYLTLLDDSRKNIIFATGPAGTGKTIIAVLSAIKALKMGLCEKIVVTRPAVSVDEQHGFLPGTLVEKMAPWTRPIFDVFEDYYSPRDIISMIEEGIIEVVPLAYMRGRNFSNCFIVADEMQNATPNQVQMLLTRISTDSKMVVTGDLNQHDRGFENNGLHDFLRRLKDYQSTYIGTVKFSKADIQRHPAVKEVLSIYNQ